jgi:hypothetical protein
MHKTNLIAERSQGTHLPDISVLPQRAHLSIAETALIKLPLLLSTQSCAFEICLNELNVDDTNYEHNPICRFPNYHIISVAKLPQVQILDTCFVNERT